MIKAHVLKSRRLQVLGWLATSTLLMGSNCGGGTSGPLCGQVMCGPNEYCDSCPSNCPPGNVCPQVCGSPVCVPGSGGGAAITDDYGSDPNVCPGLASGAPDCSSGITSCHAAQDWTAPGYPVTHSVCTPECDAQLACPPPTSGNAAPYCVLEATPPVCMLDCGNGQTCPNGMVCVTSDVPTCMWPH